MKKQFLKIAGVTREADFYKKYPTEEAFFAAHPEARNMMAMGGTPEAYPQIATFDNAFSYGVKPGPQYLAHGGSAFPQAQTEAQFFIPIYTDVANPYNKAMGGSNVEMYPNAKMMPHWGPTNVWFQDGGQEGMQQEQPELDRIGALNRTGAFANMLKATAAKSNARTAMNQVGMAKYGKELSLYAPGGYTINPNQRIASNITQQMSPTSSRFNPTPYYGVDPPSYDQQLLNNMMARGVMYNPYQGQGFYPGQQINLSDPRFYPGINPRGNMNNFLPSLYDWNNLNQFMFQVKGSPNWKFKTDIPGMGKSRGVSNIGLDEAWGLKSSDPAVREEALNKIKGSGSFRMTETPVGMFKRRMRKDYYWDPATQPNTTFKDWGTGTAGQQTAASPTQPKSSAGVPPMLQNNPAYSTPPQSPSLNIPGGTIPSSPQPSSGTRAPLLMPGQQGYGPTATASSSSSANPDADYIRNSKYPDLDQPFTGTNMTQRERLLQQLNSNDPKEVEYAKYRIGAMSDWDAMQGSRTTTISQAPSNANSMDAATAQKKASMMNPNVNQAFIDAQQSGPPYRTPVGPVVGPDGYAYGGYTGYKFGGSYNQGDVVYMTDDEIAEFVRNGGQIEEME